MKPGDRLGTYEILGPLGVGGMGEVYRARDPGLRREVAVKVLAADVVADRQRLERLRREARALASFNHPNIATIHSLDEAGGRPFLVLELIEGGSLEDRLLAGPLECDAALAIGLQVAGALEAAHARDVIHRDLKPANVLVTATGQAKVVDFGIATERRPEPSAAATAGATELTRDGMLLGTAPYMSPEQIRGEAADPRTDIWAFGCLLFEMLTGVSPFRRETMADTLAAVIEHEPDWSLVPATAPSQVMRLLRRCLRKDAHDRQHHIADVRIELAEIVAGTPAGVEPGADDAMRGAFERTPVRWSLAMGALLAGTIAFVAWRTSIDRDAASRLPPALEITDQRVVSDFAGAHRQATFSPDGTIIAFVSDASDNPEIWIKTLASGEPTQITTGETPASSPSWSPNGEQIVFARGGAGIWTVGPLGSPPPRQLIEFGRAPSFSWDGRQIVFQRGAEIWIAGNDGAGARRVEGVPSIGFPSVDIGPAFSPDGEWIAFFRQNDGPLGDLWVVRSDGVGARQLTFDTQIGGAPAWTPDGRSILYSSRRGGSRTLWIVPFDGSDPLPLTSGAGEDSDPAVSGDGRTLVYTNTRNRWHLRLRDPGESTTRGILDRPTQIAVPEFSPDGERIAFFQASVDGIHVFTVGRQEADVRRLTHEPDTRNILPQWTPDGSELLYYRTHPTPSLRRVPADGGASVELFPWAWPSHARLDPSGRTLVYNRLPDGDTPSATLLRDVETGTETTLVEPRVFRPRWAPDGTRLAGTRNNRVIVCSGVAGECHELASGAYPVWSSDGETIYFKRYRPESGASEVWAIPAGGGVERLAFDLGRLDPTDGTFDVSIDGALVWGELVTGRDELWLARLR